MIKVTFVTTGRRLDTDQPYGTPNHGRLLGPHATIKNHSDVDYGDRVWCVPNSDIKFETPFSFTRLEDFIAVYFRYPDGAENMAKVDLKNNRFYSAFLFLDYPIPLDPEYFKLCRFADQIIINIAQEIQNRAD